MPKIHLLSRFSKAYIKFAKDDKKRVAVVDKAFKLFEKDLEHPSLNLEKLRGSKTWTIRVDRGNRLFFEWSEKGDIAIFFFIGPHDSYRTFKKT
jgi:plasmid maintenance system killer protein